MPDVQTQLEREIQEAWTAGRLEEAATRTMKGYGSEILGFLNARLRSEIVESRFEPRVGGHIYDRAADGSECRWARVLAYEPPTRVVFSWDIGPTWQLETDDRNASEVEVRFVAESADRTRVELEHRHIDRHGPGWESLRDGIADDQGWPLYLTRYADVVAAST